MATKKPAKKTTAQPKFGSPAWDKKYGVKRFTKKAAPKRKKG